MAKKNTISDIDTLDIILKRLSGASMEELAQEYGVSKEYIQYHERKELTLELRGIILKQAAKVVGEALGRQIAQKILQR